MESADKQSQLRTSSQSPTETPTGLRQGGILAAGSVAASALTTLCSLLATILILRVLPRAEAGRFALLVELLYSIGLLGSLGQSVLQARLYYREGAANFDWVRDARSTVWTTLPWVVLFVIAIAKPYELTWFEALVLGSGAGLFILTSCFSSVLAQQRHYAWSSALVRLGNGLLIIPAVVILLVPSFARLHFILLCLLIFIGAVTILGALLLRRWLPRGTLRITFRQRLTGLVFLATLLSVVVTQRGLLVVAGALLTPENVAALAAVVSILRVFDLVGESAGRVFSTEMARHSKAIGPGLMVAPWLLAAMLAAVVLMGLPTVVHQFYGGRYDAALPFLPWLVAAAGLRFVEVVPRGFLAYVAPPSLLNRFAAVQCITAVVGIALLVLWTRSHGMYGLVCAAASIAAARLAISYLFTGLLRVPVKNVVVEPLEIRSEETPV